MKTIIFPWVGWLGETLWKDLSSTGMSTLSKKKFAIHYSNSNQLQLWRIRGNIIVLALKQKKTFFLTTTRSTKQTINHSSITENITSQSPAMLQKFTNVYQYIKISKREQNKYCLEYQLLFPSLRNSGISFKVDYELQVLLTSWH